MKFISIPLFYKFLFLSLLGANNIGNIYINSEPKGSKVYINGNLIGLTPLLIENLELGAHNIRLHYPGYDILDKIIILEDSELVEIDEYLFAKTGNLKILSKPIGGRVFLDNSFVGHTPLNIPELLVKKYYLRLELESHDAIYDEIHVKSNSNVIKKYNFSTEFGKIMVRLNPTGSKLKIDGKIYSSQSPEVFEIELKAGRYELEFIKSGFLSHRKDIIVRSGEDQNLNVFLKKVPLGIPSLLTSGYLMASSKTPGVKLKIKGKNNILNLPVEYMELNQGFYELTFKAKGKKTKKIKIEIEGQKTTFVKIDLESKRTLFDKLFN